jgi:hypothetical protein
MATTSLKKEATGKETTGTEGVFLYILQISQFLDMKSRWSTISLSTSSFHSLDNLISLVNLAELQWQNCQCNLRAIFFGSLSVTVTLLTRIIWSSTHFSSTATLRGMA